MPVSVLRFARRLAFVVLGVVLVWVFLVAHGGSAQAATTRHSGSVGLAAGVVACGQQADTASCDADGDNVPDAVEVVVCGSGTCATGREDSDGDGIPDWTEVMACGSTSCADPAKDTDSDGVPDFAEILVCGSATCSNGHEDKDGNGVADWIDYVICGTAGCATGQEDYDHNGISDAAELAACVKKDPGFLASTGFQAGLWALAGIVLLGGGALLMYARKKRTNTPDDGDAADTGDSEVPGGNEGPFRPDATSETGAGSVAGGRA